MLSDEDADQQNKNESNPIKEKDELFEVSILTFLCCYFGVELIISLKIHKANAAFANIRGMCQKME